MGKPLTKFSNIIIWQCLSSDFDGGKTHGLSNGVDDHVVPILMG